MLFLSQIHTIKIYKLLQNISNGITEKNILWSPVRSHHSFVMSASLSNQALAQIEPWTKPEQCTVAAHILSRKLDEEVARSHPSTTPYTRDSIQGENEYSTGQQQHASDCAPLLLLAKERHKCSVLKPCTCSPAPSSRPCTCTPAPSSRPCTCSPAQSSRPCTCLARSSRPCTCSSAPS